MIEPRVYRAAFLPAVLAFVIAMFSLESQPAPVPLDLAADVLFEGESAAANAERVARQHPDRAPGSTGNAGAAELIASELTASGFSVELDEWSEEGQELRNVIATRSGSGRDRIVVMAARDSESPPDLTGSAADSAALLELAAALEGRATKKTIVLASVDGSTLGEAGVRRFVETATDDEHIEAVLVLSDMGAGVSGGPGLVAWPDDPTRGNVALDRTAEEALLREFQDAGTGAGPPAQLAQLAMPLGIGGQGVLLDSGVEAIRFSGSGLLPPDPEPTEIDADRLGGLGRAALQTLSAIDAGGELEHGPTSYLTLGRNLLPGWAVSLLAVALILPALLAAIDAFARARRRREPVGSWSTWVLARIVPFAVGLLVTLLLAVAGLAPSVYAAPPPPAFEPFDAEAAVLLGVVAAAVALAYVLLRPVLTRWGGAPPDPTAPGAGCAVALVTTTTTLVIWVVNPWAALALVPAAHLWTLVTLARDPLRPGPAALAVAGGLLVPAALVLVHMIRLSLDPLEGLWYLFLVVAGGQIDLLAALLGCVFLGAFASVVEILIARARSGAPVEGPRPALRGPGGYAGPGSLGGTESAIKR